MEGGEGRVGGDKLAAKEWGGRGGKREGVRGRERIRKREVLHCIQEPMATGWWVVVIVRRSAAWLRLGDGHVCRL